MDSLLEKILASVSKAFADCNTFTCSDGSKMFVSEHGAAIDLAADTPETPLTHTMCSAASIKAPPPSGCH